MTRIILSCLFLCCSLLASAAEPSSREAALDERIAPAISAAIAEKKLPGCVICIGNREGIIYLKAFGNKRLLPVPAPMTTGTVFDLASLTKPIATATSVMLLVEQGKVKLTQPVATYLPDFAANGKAEITVEELLIHTSGLIPDNDIADYRDGPEASMRNILALKPKTPRGEKFAYSDMNFAALAELVRKISGKNVHEFSQEHIFVPLGMKETSYLPVEELRKRAAPTEQRDGQWMLGEVHDPRAFKLGGIAGHAGLFSTATDLSIYARMMLGHGKLGDVKVMEESTWQEMIRPREVPSVRPAGKEPAGQRALGWDIRTGFSSNRGEGMSSAAFGHGGFTGTGIWIDPEKDLFVIFLSNRVHPDGKMAVNINPLIGRVGTIAVEVLTKK